LRKEVWHWEKYKKYIYQINQTNLAAALIAQFQNFLLLIFKRSPICRFSWFSANGRGFAQEGHLYSVARLTQS